MALAGSLHFRSQGPAPVVRRGELGSRDGTEGTLAVTGTGTRTGIGEGRGKGAGTETETRTEMRVEGRKRLETYKVVVEAGWETREKG